MPKAISGIMAACTGRGASSTEGSPPRGAGLAPQQTSLRNNGLPASQWQSRRHTKTVTGGRNRRN